MELKLSQAAAILVVGGVRGFLTQIPLKFSQSCDSEEAENILFLCGCRAVTTGSSGRVREAESHPQGRGRSQAHWQVWS